MTTEQRRVKATELGVAPYGSDCRLADGAFVIHLSVQREWVYAKALTPDGRFVRRRYRPEALVAVATDE